MNGDGLCLGPHYLQLMMRKKVYPDISEDFYCSGAPKLCQRGCLQCSLEIPARRIMVSTSLDGVGKDWRANTNLDLFAKVRVYFSLILLSIFGCLPMR